LEEEGVDMLSEEDIPEGTPKKALWLHRKGELEFSKTYFICNVFVEMKKIDHKFQRMTNKEEKHRKADKNIRFKNS
jgi:hypothetical protein